MGSTVSAVLATAFKLQGLSYSVSSACSTGAHSIGMGMEQIQLGKHDVMFCGSGELENWGSTIMFDGVFLCPWHCGESTATPRRHRGDGARERARDAVDATQTHDAPQAWAPSRASTTTIPPMLLEPSIKIATAS